MSNDVPSSDSLHARVGGLLRTVTAVDVRDVDLDLLESGLLDSMGFVELIAALERDFRLRIPLEELNVDEFRSIRTIAAFLATRA